MIMVDNIKRQMRTKYKKIRVLMPQNKKKQYDDQIFENLLKCEAFKNASIILTYVSTDTEVCTEKIIEYCFQNNIKIAVPRCNKNHNMNFYWYNSSTDFEISSYGIKEPIPGKNNLASFLENAVCIVPGLAFDYYGYRLGYGGGYYDRFLSEHKRLKTIGLCYSENMIDKLVTDKYDQPVDYIITEKTLEVCSGQ